MQESDSSKKGIFDIPDAEGVNDSERYLLSLCKKSFLSLWAHANLHTSHDFRDGKGSAKEFTDVLVVFGNDVIIFSDKHIKFQNDKDLDIAWKRWYKRAIKESANQLHGAMSWLKRFPDRIFIDAQCTRSIPISLPLPEHARYHLIAVTRGSQETCLSHFPESSGTLMINSGIKGDEHENTPLTIGDIDPDKHFVHILDEFSLDFLMSEMDTVIDFIDYIKAREKLLRNESLITIAMGEEQLIASYIMNMEEDKHAFLPEKILSGMIVFDSSFYQGLMSRQEYMAKKELDKPSYFWDQLIEHFIAQGDPSLVMPQLLQSPEDSELGLRMMASESRHIRRELVHALKGMFDNSRKNPLQTFRRLVALPDEGRVYIFVASPKSETESFEEYRKLRVAHLALSCHCASLRYPDINCFIGIAFDHPSKNYSVSSQDFCILFADQLLKENSQYTENLCQELEIFTNSKEVWLNTTEFPSIAISKKLLRHENNSQKKQQIQKDKHKKRIAKNSRKRNRK